MIAAVAGHLEFGRYQSFVVATEAPILAIVFVGGGHGLRDNDAALKSAIVQSWNIVVISTFLLHRDLLACANLEIVIKGIGGGTQCCVVLESGTNGRRVIDGVHWIGVHHHIVVEGLIGYR